MIWLRGTERGVGCPPKRDTAREARIRSINSGQVVVFIDTDAPAHRLPAHRLPTHRLPTPRLPAHRLPTPRLPAHRSTFPYDQSCLESNSFGFQFARDDPDS